MIEEPNLVWGSSMAGQLSFVGPGKVYMVLTSDGRLEPGAGLSQDEATQAMFRALQEMWAKHLAHTAKAKKPAPKPKRR